MVGAGRIELPTPAMSTQCSTAELRAHVLIAIVPEGGLPIAGAQFNMEIGSAQGKIQSGKQTGNKHPRG